MSFKAFLIQDQLQYSIELTLCASCSRLSLTCLGYLWRRDQQELLAEMIACKLKAIVIKVAALGNFFVLRY